MDKRRILQVNILISLLSLLMLFVPLCIFSQGEQNGYFSFGPNDSFIVLGVVIDTWTRYFVLLGLLTVVWVKDLIVQEFALPILNFSVYNPDCTEITEFGKNELQLYAHAIYTVEGLKWVLQMVINISQFDVALAGVIIKNVVSIYTIRILLNKKTFKAKANPLHEQEMNDEKTALITELEDVVCAR